MNTNISKDVSIKALNYIVKSICRKNVHIKLEGKALEKINSNLSKQLSDGNNGLINHSEKYLDPSLRSTSS